MMEPRLTYVGDKKVRVQLDRYGCPVPFHAVCTRFLGTIATPRFGASPIEAIKDLWGGDLPEFDDMASLNALLQDLMSLWNNLVKHQSRSKPFRLARAKGGLATVDLRRLCQIRTEELEGFIDGLFGNEERIDLPERAHEGMDHLGDINAMFRGLVELVTRESAPSPTDDDIRETLNKVRDLTRIAEKELHAVILSCRRARAQMPLRAGYGGPTEH